ncbi:MAG: hypothetical protein ACI8ZM_002688 [Crocinitomix sp.]|jgi:hypothetical protein
MRQLILGIFTLSFATTFGQYNGLEMFDESFVHEIRINFEQEDYWDSLEYYFEQHLELGAEKKYMVASVEIDGNVIDSVGVREKGFYSNYGSDGLKEPLKIDFNVYVPGTKYDGLKKLNLQNGFRDPTMMRDALSYKFMRDAGIAAPRSSYARVYLNDIYWGLYIVVEQIDDRFLKNWFENNDGDLFKCISNTTMEWEGTAAISYQDDFELKTNEELNNWDDFVHLIDKINTADEFDDSISTALQMNNYLRVLAADVLMFNWDSHYDNGRNFFVYYDSTASAFQWIPWDYNLGFSNYGTGIVLNYDGGVSSPKPLVINVMESEIYRAQYFNHLCILIENYFNLENLEPYIDETKLLITDALEEDPNKYFNMGEFNANIDLNISSVNDLGFEEVVPGLKLFIKERYATVISQLEPYAHNCTALGIAEGDQIEASHVVYPNPSNTGLFNVVFGDAVQEISVYSMTGQIIYSQTVTGQTQTEIDLSAFGNGVYIVELLGETRELKRVVIQ